MQVLAKFIYFRIMGWSLLGDFPYPIKKCVLPVVSHTSWLDFFLGILVRKVWNTEINYIGKKSLFKWPFGWYFRRVGGVPIDRSKSNDAVSATAKIFEERKIFRLSLAPEGTRKKVMKLKTGFYYIAKAANVPIVLVAFDYGKKQVKISEPYYVTEDIAADFKYFNAFYKGVIGKVPKYSYAASEI